MKEAKFEFEDKTYLVKITSKALNDSQRIYNRTFKKAIEDGAILRHSLEKHLKEQKIWDDSKEDAHQKMIKEMAHLERKLNQGGIKLTEAKELALRLSDIRQEMFSLIAEKNAMSQNTAEGLADSERFNFLVSACCIDYLTNKPVFSSYEDFMNRSEEPLAAACANKFAEVFYDVEPNFGSNFTETKFLKRFGYVDEKGRLIDKVTGKLIDRDGNFINEEGYKVNAEGQRIDINNELIPDTNVDTAEFLEE